MNLTKEYIEKKYNCILIRDSGFDDSRLVWTAFEKDEEDEEELGEYLADGWALAEIEKKIIKKVGGK